MISFCLKGHSYKNEVQTTIQIFYPNTNYEQINNVNENGLVVVSGIEEKFAYCSLYKNGKLINISKNFFTYEEKSNMPNVKLSIKTSIYHCLKNVTGYKPTWGIVTGIRPAKYVNEFIDKGLKKKEIVSTLRKRNFVNKKKAKLSYKVAKYERKILKLNKDGNFSLYIGIPFCPSKCLYCSFTSFPINKYLKTVDLYLDKLIEEIKYLAENVDKNKLMTIYIGGGTPTSISAVQLEKLLKAVNDAFEISKVLEFTVEAGRVDTITKEKLLVLKKYNVGRISINPQTMNNKTLNLIGRNHNAEEVKKIFNVAREVGFDNINMDLIIGLPEETTKDVEHTLKEIKKLNPDSVTVHTLTVKRASRLKENFENYSLTEIETIENMLKLCSKYTKKMEMKPYYMYRQKNTLGNFENVGYCKENKACIYNIEIMEEKQTILAVGAGSTSKIYTSETNELTRIFNLKGVEEYMARFDEMIERKKEKAFDF